MFKIHSKAWIDGYNAVIDQFNTGTPAHCGFYSGQELVDWHAGAESARTLYNIA
jgi:hypothetical protein